MMNRRQFFRRALYCLLVCDNDEWLICPVKDTCKGAGDYKVKRLG